LADFDATPLAGIEGALPPAEFRTFVEEYLASSLERLAKVETVAAGGDLTALAREAHTLISTSGSYGIARASALARQLETACKAGHADEAQALLHDVAASSRRGLTAMRERFLGAAV
jgi:HPt (histidine-containing phosphotransfer) domain-containing protein